MGVEQLFIAGNSAAEAPAAEMVDAVLNSLAVEGRKDDTVILGARWTT